MRKGQLLTQCLVKYKVSALFVFLSLTVFVNVFSNFLLSSIINILLLSDCSLSVFLYLFISHMLAENHSNRVLEIHSSYFFWNFVMWFEMCHNNIYQIPFGSGHFSPFWKHPTTFIYKVLEMKSIKCISRIPSTYMWLSTYFAFYKTEINYGLLKNFV